MVCKKCEAKQVAKKDTSLAVTDVWKASGSGSDQRNERKVGGNKLLEAKKKYGGALPASSQKGAAAGAGTGVGSSKRGASQETPFPKCKVCKVTVSTPGALYCQSKCFEPCTQLVGVLTNAVSVR